VNPNRNSLKQIYPDCWHWIRLAGRLPGELTGDEANVLFQLARSRTPAIHPLIVELGASHGKTSLLLAAGLRCKSLPRLFSFDKSGASSEVSNCRRERTLERLIRRCHLESLADTHGDSADAAVNWREGIDILFINASEDYEALKRDLALWSPFVRTRGIVVLHGGASEPAALSRAVAENLPMPLYGDLRQIGGLAWAVKMAPAPPTSDLEQYHPGVEQFGIARRQDYLRRAAKELAKNRHAVRVLRRSWSWRLTAPLRLVIETSHTIAGLLGSFGRGSPKARFAGLAQWIRFRRQVRTSGLLDEHYYRDNHPGVAWAQASPLLHFFVCGAGEGNQPNELFNIDYYLGRYPDVATSGVNPLVHYLKSGAYEGRDPHPHFDSSFYLEQNRDVLEAGLNPLAHYLAPGIAEGRDPNPWFDTSDYLEQNHDVVDFAMNPLAHQAWLNCQG